MNRLFAFAYSVTSPLEASYATTVQEWLDHQSLAAIPLDRCWGGRVVVGPQGSHILVVSDAADPDDAITLMLEAELLRRKVSFAIAGPMAIDLPVHD